MVSNLTKEHDRRSQLSSYLYGVSTLLLSGTGIGGLSPLVAGGEIGMFNYCCLVLGTFGTIAFAYAANKVMKYKN